MLGFCGVSLRPHYTNFVHFRKSIKLDKFSEKAMWTLDGIYLLYLERITLLEESRHRTLLWGFLWCYNLHSKAFLLLSFWFALQAKLFVCAQCEPATLPIKSIINTLNHGWWNRSRPEPGPLQKKGRIKILDVFVFSNSLIAEIFEKILLIRFSAWQLWIKFVAMKTIQIRSCQDKSRVFHLWRFLNISASKTI